MPCRQSGAEADNGIRQLWQDACRSGLTERILHDFSEYTNQNTFYILYKIIADEIGSAAAVWNSR